MKFLLYFCGNRVLTILSIVSLVSLFLDLTGIALIYPFLKLFISPEIIQNNVYTQQIVAYFNFGSEKVLIFAIGTGLLLFYLVRFVLKIMLNKVRFRVSNDVTFRLSSGLFSGLLKAQYALFTEQSTSEMVGIINAHTIFCMICLESWIVILNETFFLLIMVLAFIYINPFVTLVLIAFFFLIGFSLYMTLSKKLAAMGTVHARLNLLVYKFAFAVANTIKDIKIMGLENKFIDSFSDIWRDYSSNDSRSKTVRSIPKDFSETLVFGGIVLLCLYILSTRQNMMNMVPMLGVIAVSTMRILPSFNRIATAHNEYKYHKNSLVIVENLYATVKRYEQIIDHVEAPFDAALSIKNVDFRFKDRQVLESLSITIRKGSSVAFVGPSGAGKSTLLDVLVGLREAAHGEFRLDGLQFDPFRTDILRSRIGYVPQQVNLVDNTIAFNISFEEHHDTIKMDKVIRMSRLMTYIDDLEQGVNTVIGESGVRVSGGQRQRIGIARALYRDPEILVFDEATSALDNVTERELMVEINALSGSKTLLIVAHRLSTVENCDVIFLLEQGKIIAQGKHNDLLESSAAYRNLYQQQLQ